MTKLFISYSHKDESFKDELLNHLSMLKRSGIIDVWHDRKINAGDEFDHEISEHLESANIILLLISSDFLNSNYCYDKEMTKALEMHNEKIARVIPVILRHCDWKNSPFKKITTTPKDGFPISEQKSQDGAFLEVVNEIRRVVESKKKIVSSHNNNHNEVRSKHTQPNNIKIIASKYFYTFLVIGIISAIAFLFLRPDDTYPETFNQNPSEQNNEFKNLSLNGVILDKLTKKPIKGLIVKLSSHDISSEPTDISGKFHILANIKTNKAKIDLHINNSNYNLYNNTYKLNTNGIVIELTK